VWRSSGTGHRPDLGSARPASLATTFLNVPGPGTGPCDREGPHSMTPTEYPACATVSAATLPANPPPTTITSSSSGISSASIDCTTDVPVRHDGSNLRRGFSPVPYDRHVVPPVGLWSSRLMDPTSTISRLLCTEISVARLQSFDSVFPETESPLERGIRNEACEIGERAPMPVGRMPSAPAMAVDLDDHVAEICAPELFVGLRGAPHQRPHSSIHVR